MKWRNGSFVKCIWVRVAAASVFLLFTHLPPVNASVHRTPGEDGKEALPEQGPDQVAESFLKQVSGHPVEKIRSLKLSYDVHMQLEGYVKAKMRVTLEMKKEQDHYTATFSLTAPEGKDLWSRFVLYVFGQHTSEYQEMVKAIETKIREKFYFNNGRFRTVELKEVLPEVKKYENQTGMRIYFDYKEKLIKFWEDQTKKDFNKAIAYSDQVGPMTGFFNFLLFERPEAELSVVNALKRTKFVGNSKDRSQGTGNIEFVFGSQVVRLHRNDTGRHNEYHNAIYFQDENYLDIIYGKNVFYELAKGAGSKVKVPYSIMLEGIISKTKKREKEERLRELMEKELGREIFEEQRRRIEAYDEFAARDVKVLLTRAEVGLDM